MTTATARPSLSDRARAYVLPALNGVGTRTNQYGLTYIPSRLVKEACKVESPELPHVLSLLRASGTLQEARREE